MTYRIFVPALIGLALFAWSVPVEAGRAGKVSRGISRATGSSRGGGGHGGRAGGRGVSHGSNGRVGHGSSHGAHAARRGLTIGWRPAYVAATGQVPTQAEVYAGVEKVVESDHALNFEGALISGRLRLAGALSSYAERQGLGGAAPVLYLNVASLTGGVRVTDAGSWPSVYLDAGVAGVWTVDDPISDSSVKGFTAGIRVEQPLAKHAAALVDGRALILSDDVRATEVRAGLQLGPLRLAYRVMDFNVGPALHGPEIGLGVRF